ncbi:MAG: rRNA maturation RNase YbeY [Rhodobacteraceae bacterium]|nr:rRNA maturation RNase YbeY [Paracoccaceae bacterium]
MRPLVDTMIQDPRWQGFGLADAAERAARTTLAAQGLDPDRFAISLMGCDDVRIAALNGDFRAKPAPTNVLSWPSDERGAAADGGRPDRPDPGTPDSPAELGDIAIAWETCVAEASVAEKPLHDHVTHLIVHATLHLLGYDHIREGDATRMEATETGILASLGVADPYA